VLENKMAFLNADDMKWPLRDSGEVAVYGLYFDTDKDAIRSESQSALAEIAKLMKSEPALRLHIVGHTDNQGKPDYNLDLSHRRATSVVAELSSKYGIGANRLDAFGCGMYSPVASNEAEDWSSEEPPSGTGAVVVAGQEWRETLQSGSVLQSQSAFRRIRIGFDYSNYWNCRSGILH
jgi:outer membrane protein OmpA-like peptidoglycan-associated protein